MKHEAFTEAVSMIDDKFIEEAQKPFPKRKSASAVKICVAAAACAAAICAVLFIPRGKAADILINGENPSESPVTVLSQKGRSGDIAVHLIEIAEIPVEITAEGKTSVSVSGGTVSLAENGSVNAKTELEIEGKASLLWSVVLGSESEEFTFTAKSGSRSRVLTLAFDENRNGWVIREKSAY